MRKNVRRLLEAAARYGSAEEQHVAQRSEVVTAIKTARRQQAVVEYHAVPAPRWLVLLPNGGIRACHSASEALAGVQQAAKRGNRGVTITTIEWRDVPDGFVPPKGGGQ